MLQVETPNTSNNLENEPHMSLVHWMFLRSQTCSRLYLVSLAEGRRAAALMLLWDVGLLRERSVFDLLYQRWPLVSNWVSTAITIAASLSLNHRGFVYVCVCSCESMILLIVPEWCDVWFFWYSVCPFLVGTHLFLNVYVWLCEYAWLFAYLCVFGVHPCTSIHISTVRVWMCSWM